MQVHLPTLRPWFRKNTGIVGRYFYRHGCRSGAPVTFDVIRGFRMHVMPGIVVRGLQADRIDDHGVALPVTHRIPVPSGSQPVGMRISNANDASLMVISIADY